LKSLIGTTESDMLDFSALWLDWCVCVFFQTMFILRRRQRHRIRSDGSKSCARWMGILVIKFIGPAWIRNL